MITLSEAVKTLAVNLDATREIAKGDIVRRRLRTGSVSERLFEVLSVGSESATIATTTGQYRSAVNKKDLIHVD